MIPLVVVKDRGLAQILNLVFGIRSQQCEELRALHCKTHSQCLAVDLVAMRTRILRA